MTKKRDEQSDPCDFDNPTGLTPRQEQALFGSQQSLLPVDFRRKVSERLKHFSPLLPKEEYEARKAQGTANKRFGTLNLGNCGIDAFNLAWVLHELRSLKGIRCLMLGDNSIGDEGLKLLAAAEMLQSLPILNLQNNRITAVGAKALCAVMHLDELTSLHLAGNQIGDDGAKAISNATHLDKLISLNLNGNQIGRVGATALAAATHLDKLTSLHFGGNQIGADGAKALAAAAHLDKLTSLDLGGNQIGDDGAIALAAATHMDKLTSLDLGGNQIGSDGAIALAAATHLGKLTSLNLGGNQIGDAQIVIELLQKFVANGILKVCQFAGNVLRWKKNRSAISLAVLDETCPEKLLAALLRIKEEGIMFGFARGVMAGTSTSGKTHLSLRMVSPTDTKYDQVLTDELYLSTAGVVRRDVMIDAAAHGVRGHPAIKLMIQDVGGHNEQIRSHFHLVYLAGEAIFLLCIRVDRPIDHWPRYYLHLLADLARRAYNGKRQQNFYISELKSMPPEDRMTVIVVPTHADAPELDDQTRVMRKTEIMNICADDGLHTLNIVTKTGWVNNLNIVHVLRVMKRVAIVLKEQSHVVSLVEPYVPAIRDEVEKLFTPPGGASGEKLVASLSLDRLKKIFTKHAAAGYRDENFDYMVRELLRTGVALTPLDKTPLREDQVENRLHYLLNPAFVNEVVYKQLLMDPAARTGNGFLTKSTLLQRAQKWVGPLDQDLVFDILAKCNVIFPYKRAGGTAGYLVPDQFEFTEKFVALAEPTMLRGWSTDGFVPEHALFELMAKRKDLIEPINKGDTFKPGVYAYRNECHFRQGDALVQVYLNVLTRKLCMCGRGPEAVALIEKLYRDIEDEKYCPWKQIENWQPRTEEEQCVIKKCWKTLIKESKDNNGNVISSPDTLAEYKKGYISILRAWSSEERADSISLTTDEILDRSPVKSLNMGVSYIRNLLKQLTTKGLVIHKTAAYELAPAGQIALSYIDEHGNERPATMPTFNPDQ
jgi:hypothetical protein